MEANSAKEMMEKNLKLEEKTRLMTILLLWLWWSEQNNYREEGRRRTATEVAYVTAAMADRFQANKTTTLLLPNSGQIHKWRRPDLGVFKTNSDGAFDSKTGTGAWGLIIRNDEGAMLKAGARREMALQSAFHAELLGCHAGLRAAASLGISQIVLDTDASLVKTAVEGNEYRLAALGGIIAEIQSFMLSEFINCEVFLCPRSCNSGADALAAFRSSLSSGMQSTWDHVPQFIEASVTSDLAESDQ
jgi:hypothetical protein